LKEIGRVLRRKKKNKLGRIGSIKEIGNLIHDVRKRNVIIEKIEDALPIIDRGVEILEKIKMKVNLDQ
jgi:hypothetical protein